MNRKIDLPEYCCPSDRNVSGGKEDCDHDFPLESKREYDTYLKWTCSKCGMRISFGVYQ